jgi:hypothetical protein
MKAGVFSKSLANATIETNRLLYLLAKALATKVEAF